MSMVWIGSMLPVASTLDTMSRRSTEAVWKSVAVSLALLLPQAVAARATMARREVPLISFFIQVSREVPAS